MHCYIDNPDKASYNIDGKYRDATPETTWVCQPNASLSNVTWQVCSNCCLSHITMHITMDAHSLLTINRHDRIRKKIPSLNLVNKDQWALAL